MRARTEETPRTINDEIGDNHFSNLLNESHDKSIKEQIAMIMRCVKSR